MSRRSSAVQRHAKEIMSDRPALSASEFASVFFPPKHAEIAACIRDILGRVLIVDVSRITAEDRLVEDLGLGMVDGLDPNFLEIDIRDELHVDIGSSWPTLKTVRDLVNLVGERCPTDER